MYLKNLNHVNSFLNVVKTGSISSASRLMRKSQTSISNNVVSLEIELGVDLLIREGHKARPTEEALRLIPYMENLLSYQRILSSVADEIFSSKPQLHIFIDKTVSSNFLSLSHFLIEEHNDKTVNIHRGSDPEKFINSQRGDLCIVISMCDQILLPKLDIQTLGVREDVIVFSPTQSNEKLNTPLSFNDIVNLRQIYVSGSIPELQSNPLSSNVCYVDSYDDAIHLIKNGFGWGILPYYVVKDDLENSHLIMLNDNEKHDSVLQHTIYCYSSPVLRDSLGFKHFLDNCKQNLSRPAMHETLERNKHT